MMQLNGLGAVADDVTGFLASTPSPSSAQISDFLKLYQEPDRSAAAQALIAAGVDATTVMSASKFLAVSGSISRNTIWGLLSIASAAASGYHGIKRNHGSLGWGAWWFLMGGLFPVFTPLVAIARSPGFAQPK